MRLIFANLLRRVTLSFIIYRLLHFTTVYCWFERIWIPCPFAEGADPEIYLFGNGCWGKCPKKGQCGCFNECQVCTCTCSQQYPFPLELHQLHRDNKYRIEPCISNPPNFTRAKQSRLSTSCILDQSNDSRDLCQPSAVTRLSLFNSPWLRRFLAHSIKHLLLKPMVHPLVFLAHHIRAGYQPTLPRHCLNCR